MSSACTHSVVYNGTPCPDYVKKLDLTKPNETPTPNPSSNYTPGNNQSNNTQAKPVNSGFSFSSLFSFKGRIRRTAYWLTNFGLSLLLLPANLTIKTTASRTNSAIEHRIITHNTGIFEDLVFFCFVGDGLFRTRGCLLLMMGESVYESSYGFC